MRHGLILLCMRTQDSKHAASSSFPLWPYLSLSHFIVLFPPKMYMMKWVKNSNLRLYAYRSMEGGGQRHKRNIFQRGKKKVLSSFCNFSPFHFQFSTFPFLIFFFFSNFPFFLASLFPVGQQKFPGEKCQGALCPPSPSCYATGGSTRLYEPKHAVCNIILSLTVC